MPTFNTSNPWRSRSQPAAPRQPRPAPSTAPPPASSSSPSSRPRSPTAPAHEPEPVDDRTRSLTTLAKLAARFHHLDRDTLLPSPSSLVFTPKASASAPKLAFTPVNAPVHGYEEALTRLLTELDAVDSAGDLAVRQQRKNLVTAVDQEAQRVERWRRDCFEARERGEEGPHWVKAGRAGEGQAHEQASDTQGVAPPRAQDGQREAENEHTGSLWAGGPPPAQGHADMSSPSRRELPGQFHPARPSPAYTSSSSQTRQHPDPQTFRAAPGARPPPSYASPPSRRDAEPRFAPRSSAGGARAEPSRDDGWYTAGGRARASRDAHGGSRGPERYVEGGSGVGGGLGEGGREGEGARWGSRNPYARQGGASGWY
ncbi:hypothetical protein JCM8208_005752 [Rhodotorula glutinis]